MAVSVAELKEVVGKPLRVKIAIYDCSTTAIEYAAVLERVWADQGEATFYIGYTRLRIKIADIISFEGGHQANDEWREKTVNI